MSLLCIDELRSVQMSGVSVSCLTVTGQHLLWCSPSDGAPTLHMWEFQEEQPSIEPLIELGFTPVHISSFEEKVLVVGITAAALFMVEKPLFAGVTAMEESEGEGEKITVTEEFVCSDIPTGVNHIAWTPDGSAVALSSPEGLCLVDCRIGSQGKDCGSNEHWRCLILDCKSWYNESGAAFTAFSASRLFLISTRNHLVMTRYNNNNFIENDGFCKVDPQLERDGHIIVRAHHVMCFSIGGSEEGHLVVGLSDGTLLLLQQETLEVFFTLDVTKHLYRMLNTPPPDAEKGNMYVLNVAVGRQFMLVVRSDAVACYDKKSMNMLAERTTILSGEATILSACSGNGSWCIWSPQKEELLYYSAEEEYPVGVNSADDIVHAQVSLPSHLLEPLLLPFQQQNSAPRAGGNNNKKCKTTKVMEKSVTFGHPIKSSGYARSVPWSVQQLRTKQGRERARKAVRRPTTDALPLRYKALSIPEHPFQLMSTANKILFASPIHRAVVTSAVFATSGSALLTASGDATANWLKYPVDKYKGEGTLMAAHTSPVNTADASLSIKAPIIATGSSDGVVAMWQPLKQEAPYIMQKVCKAVRVVKFFYTDKFICYASGNNISLCQYALDNGGGDLHRKRNESRMKSVLEFSENSAQSVVSLDCMNYFTSNLILWAGSNKSVGIYDVSATQNIQVVEEAHARPIHRVAMMTASRYAAPGANLLHMYLTAGFDNTVRLWDLRQRRSVRQLSLHRNSAAPVGVAFSPNGTMVAVGSETRAICVYDVGTGAVVDKVTVSDTPTALCWHPLEGVLAAGTASGAIHLMEQR